MNERSRACLFYSAGGARYQIRFKSADLGTPGVPLLTTVQPGLISLRREHKAIESQAHLRAPGKYHIWLTVGGRKYRRCIFGNQRGRSWPETQKGAKGPTWDPLARCSLALSARELTPVLAGQCASTRD